MPSHIYFRIGDYDASATANLAAIKADKVYLRERNPKGIYPMMYVAAQHAVPVGVVHDGGQQPRRVQSVARARRRACRSTMVRQMPMAEGDVADAIFHRGSLRQVGRDSQGARAAGGSDVHDRSLALRARPRVRGEESSRRRAEGKKQLDAIIAATPPDRIVGFNSANRLLALASATLAGEIDSAQGNHDDAIKQLQQAVAIQDSLNYEEPPAWYYPVRETLGMELLADGKTAEAEQVFRDDLKQYPENGWSLDGLAICLRARNASDEAPSVEARFKKAWAHADVTLPASAAPSKEKRLSRTEPRRRCEKPHCRICDRCVSCRLSIKHLIASRGES